MKSKIITTLTLLSFIFIIWSCKDVAPTVPEGVTFIEGIVYDVGTDAVIPDAAVYLSASGYTDSAYTGSDGGYQFEVDLSKLSNTSASLTVTKPGYLPRSVAISVAKDTLVDVGLSIDASTLAIVTGIVRDSVSMFRQDAATVLLALPGDVKSAVTPKEGTFRLIADLIDLDSLMVTLTVYKSGFQTKVVPLYLYRGQTADVGDILLAVDKGSTVAQVQGKVFDAQSRLPLTNSAVTVITNIKTDSMMTSFNGEYSFSIDLQGLPSIPGLIKVAKNGYKPQTADFSVEAGKTFSADFYLVRDTTTGVRDSSDTGLYAHSIAFVSMTQREISVYGVGGTESSIIIWEVRDSLGFPIDIDHRDTVEFKLEGVPVSGGAYVSPDRAITNVSGRVATTVNSGTVSGVLQFIAKLHREQDGVTIQSTPVIITVNAGLPDQVHFSIGADQINFAAYDWVNRTNGILVQVGDKYSNPVKTGTAVYFNSTAGVVMASGFTDPTSHARVNLMSGNPLPVLPELASNPSLFGDGTGYVWVKAQTLGEGSAAVSDSILLLMSASSEIYVTAPPNLHVDSGTCVQVPVRISDRFGNPLAPGTQIATEVQFSPPEGTNWAVTATGLPKDPLADYLTRGPGRTDFMLTICDATAGGTPQQMPFVVTIRVTGPNGNVFTTLNGVVGP